MPSGLEPQSTLPAASLGLPSGSSFCATSMPSAPDPESTQVSTQVWMYNVLFDNANLDEHLSKALTPDKQVPLLVHVPGSGEKVSGRFSCEVCKQKYHRPTLILAGKCASGGLSTHHVVRICTPHTAQLTLQVSYATSSREITMWHTTPYTTRAVGQTYKGAQSGRSGVSA